MRPEELMIGDWVYHSKHGNAQICVIDDKFGDDPEITIKSPNIKHKEGYEYGYCIDDLESVFPFPLTPEILEKNGFEKDPEDGTMCWGNKELEEISWRGTILKIDSLSASLELVSCMYVHQLQHALKLCGIGIEIKL